MQINSESLRGELKRFFGFNSFKPMQEEVILHLTGGDNAFVLMPTGGGKSLCYQLPALLMEGTAIIISPLIALMKNQVDAIRGFAVEEEGIAHFLNSSLNRTQLNEVKRDLLQGVTKLLYVAPESLTKEENIALLKQIKVSFYAIDEAHCISEWGHDFRPEYRRISPISKEIGEAPIIALTATATPKVQSDIQKNLGIPDAKVFKTSFNRPNLYYEVRWKEDVDREIVRFLKEHRGKSGIIYCLSRRKVEEIALFLEINGIRALPYHAGLDSATRATNQDKFLMEEVEVIVATIAFGMGIDKPDVRFVIHYDMPKSLEGYYQETGRAGRDGGEGRCISFYSYKDILRLDKFMHGKPVAEQEIGRQLLAETVAYAESSLCRRVLLLNYFGESYSEACCCSCDNCLNPQEKYEAKEDLLLLLELISGMKEQFKSDHIATIIAGESNSIIKSYDHDKLPLYGAGKEEGYKYWMALVREATVHKFLEREIERYGVLSITPKGESFLAEPHSIQFTKERHYEESDEDDIALAGEGGDPILLSMLKQLRSSISQKLKLPPFVIFNDMSLDEMTINYPITIDELKQIHGVGEGKARRYGKEFLELIEKYVEENEIDRPLDFVVKSVATSTHSKVDIIRGIDRKQQFEDIAHTRGMEMEVLIGEVEAIVNAGTRLDINYYLQQTVDEDKIDDIYDYFRYEATSDSLEEAADELGPNYSEEEIRLVRIKFLSELGN